MLQSEQRLPRKAHAAGESGPVQVNRFAYGEEPFTARWGELSLREPSPYSECWIVPGRAGVTAEMLPLDGLGRVGHFGARDREAAVAVLHRAADSLFRRGASKVIGPMDGSTWERYRLALEGPAAGDSFRGEPVNPPEYGSWFEAAGFRRDQLYTSTISTNLDSLYPELDRLESRSSGRIRIRPLADLEADLRALHTLSLDAFRHNIYYSPISFEQFASLYRPLAPLLQPELVLVAHEGPRPVGFVLSYPDQAPGRLVLKTLATATDCRGLGLGTLLTARIHQVARRQGFHSVIHALMHTRNASQHVSRRASSGDASLWRTYALFSRETA